MFTLPPFIFFQAAGHLLYLYYRKQTLLYMKRFVIGILAHVDAGKTTMSEAILYETGKLKKMGRVDNRDAFLDGDGADTAGAGLRGAHRQRG